MLVSVDKIVEPFMYYDNKEAEVFLYEEEPTFIYQKLGSLSLKRLTTSSGIIIEATDFHKVMLANGMMIAMKDLKKGMVLAACDACGDAVYETVTRVTTVSCAEGEQVELCHVLSVEPHSTIGVSSKRLMTLKDLDDQVIIFVGR